MPCAIILGTLEDVVRLHDRFRKTFGLAITASQFEDLVRLQEPDAIAMSEIFAVLDTNRDGRIDGLEFLAAVACVCRATFEDKARCTCLSLLLELWYWKAWLIISY